MYIPEHPSRRKFGVTGDLNWSGVFGSHTPISDIEVVCSPTGNHSCAELFTTQPAWPCKATLRMNSFFGIAHIWCWSKPLFIIEIRRHRHFFFYSRLLWIVDRKTDVNALQFADPAVAHKFTCLLELWH